MMIIVSAGKCQETSGFPAQTAIMLSR